MGVNESHLKIQSSSKATIRKHIPFSTLLEIDKLSDSFWKLSEILDRSQLLWIYWINEINRSENSYRDVYGSYRSMKSMCMVTPS